MIGAISRLTNQRLSSPQDRTYLPGAMWPERFCLFCGTQLPAQKRSDAFFCAERHEAAWCRRPDRSAKE